MPTNFTAGKTAEIFIIGRNIGAGSAVGPITITSALPPGLTPLGADAGDNEKPPSGVSCAEPLTQTISCTSPGPLGSGRQITVNIPVEVSAGASGFLGNNETAISSPGAVEVKAKTPIQIDSNPPPFGFLTPLSAGFSAPITKDDGSAATSAGSHPYQLTTSFGLPTERAPGAIPEGAGHLRDLRIDLPRGQMVSPASTPVLCTEVQLISAEECPPDSQVGLVTVITVPILSAAAKVSPLFNMVPPPGQAASLGFDALGVGIYVHTGGELRSDGDYGLSGTVSNIFARPQNPAFGGIVDLWGDPGSSLHDEVRGRCLFDDIPPCPASEPADTALATMPSDCPGKPTVTEAHAKSWEEASAPPKTARYESADPLSGAPASVSGCNELKFEPRIEAKPTTNLTDSPSGLDLSVHQPQDTKATGRSTANLKDTTITFPEGLVVNPAAASGQGACGPAQIGLLTPVGQSPARFSKVPASCPNAAKIGTLEVSSPLLALRDESGTKVLRDAEGDPIPRPVSGSLYLAEPFQNPFGSLLAVYLDVEDPQSGIVAKLAARVLADPVTGQLRNILTEAPELPIEDFKIHVFEGPRAALRTPPTCTTHTTTAQFVPWSAPQAPAAAKADSFALSAAPRSAPCPATADTAPNQPDFVAGTITPQAGAYSPFVLRISREDGSQPIGGFEATLPRGIAAKLAGIPYCQEAAIAQARSREVPNQGRTEQADPSCPATSEIGTVEVAAGAGPTPYVTTGHVYLAGPYKGAPLSSVIITPAVAGPFDLGAVVVRAAAYLNPETAEVRVLSDPLPQILEGIPLDLRSATVRLSRPQFTLNPTSCDPKAALATATSIFGQAASLRSPFQVGGCKGLGFKPKLSLRLKGPTKRTGHPKLIVSGRIGGPGQANLKRISIAFPRTEFLDQAHIGTVCTRVQFAAKQCPARSVYGSAKATTPLLDEPLRGKVYLRSSSNELPDGVLALGGQVEAVLVNRIDSVNGGIRVTAEGVPDVPVSKFTVELQGGRKGLLINSTNLCAKPSYATVKMTGHNGKTRNFKALMKNDCPKKKKGKGKRRR